MSITFPVSLDSLPNPTSTDLMENATLELDHDQQHANANDAIEALEAKVGIDSSAVTTSHDYKLGEVTSSDKAVGKTATQTLTNKTLTSPVINVTSDATGDIYYRSAGGLFTRLAAGASDTILSIVGGLPSWISNPSAANTSYTVKGIIQLLTDAATSGLSVSSGVVNVNTGTGANQIVKLNSSSQIPAVSGALLTNLPSTMVVKNGSTTKDMTANTTTTIAHGLGTTPKLVKIHMNVALTDAASILRAVSSYGSYDGSTQNCHYVAGSTNGTTLLSGQDTSNGVHYGYGASAGADVDKMTGVISCDATNITITWTETNSTIGTGNIHWEVMA